MPKSTKTNVKQMVEELLAIQTVVERYHHLQKNIKAAMEQLNLNEVEVDAGRVVISTAERMTIDPTIARRVLGDALANKVIKVKEVVSSRFVKAFAEVGDISEAQLYDLQGRAEKKTVVRLHIRPLK